MEQVSTNMTLVLRLFIPIFFAVLLGAVVVFLWTHPQGYYGSLRGDYLRIGATVAYVLFLVVVYFSLWRLRRVEISGEWVYVTDFYRHARYPWTNVACIRKSYWGIIDTVTIQLREGGIFGRRITFIPSRARWRYVQEEYPDILREKLTSAG